MLLLVGVLHFVVVRAAITKALAPYLRNINKLIFLVQSIKRLCTDFWSPYLVQRGLKLVNT